jgi:hypothetical protein
VRGYFPTALLEQWDIYDEERVSENERPDFYENDQLFAIIMLENGGNDLEHTELNGWEEAANVFWQVAFALARGEKERQFEVLLMPHLHPCLVLTTCLASGSSLGERRYPTGKSGSQ